MTNEQCKTLYECAKMERDHWRRVAEFHENEKVRLVRNVIVFCGLLVASEAVAWWLK